MEIKLKMLQMSASHRMRGRKVQNACLFVPSNTDAALGSGVRRWNRTAAMLAA